jgi:hypothetical protein
MIYMDRKLKEAKKKAKELNIPNWETLKTSRAQNKRFSIKSPSGKLINFGLWPFDTGDGTFLDHKNEKIKSAWYARHSKILKIGGGRAIDDPESPAFYSARILW